ncbi:MAG: cobyrinate a,c-diamide synthase [Treponema sp.]|nr:cobyrinate a,c-diamide synthase [Treponema sp.]
MDTGQQGIPRILITGTHSGCGKTTLSCGLLSAFKARGLHITAFKCGPDYIDPMFHRSITGVEAYNLDPFFLPGEALRGYFTAKMRHPRSGTRENPSLAVLEGAMGYYDGIGATCQASSYEAAETTKTPVILVVDMRGLGNSVFALIEGFVHYKEDGGGICGIIFNGMNETRYLQFKPELEKRNLKAFGYFPYNQAWRIESRHLGLTTAAEIPFLQEKLEALGRQAAETVDLAGLLELAGRASDVSLGAVKRVRKVPGPRVRLAVASDESFCFLYQENLELLEDLGCDLAFFSPIHDAGLPEGSCGLLLCGGYPELYARGLAENVPMRIAVYEAIRGLVPTIAECGGFLYLHKMLDGLPMAGVLEAQAFKTKQLQRFGYVTLKANRDTLLCKAGDAIRAHEFHYWESTDPGCDFTASKNSGMTYACIHARDSLYMGFPHLYFPANPDFARRFVRKMQAYQKGRV